MTINFFVRVHQLYADGNIIAEGHVLQDATKRLDISDLGSRGIVLSIM